MTIPDATAHAIKILDDSNVDVKTCSATDSIAGMVGSLDAAILSPDYDLEQLDIRFEQAYVKDKYKVKSFIDESGYSERAFTPDGRYIGKFITGRKYQENMDDGGAHGKRIARDPGG